MDIQSNHEAPDNSNLAGQVRSAVIWRSGTQILAQLIAWSTTLVVIRILAPADYGLFAMTQVVLAFLTFMNGYGFASSLIQAERIDPHRVRQAFGMLLLLNGTLAATQLFVIAPLAAHYYAQPLVADLLRWQSLLYLSTPFLAIPDVMLGRQLDFRKSALINMASAICGAATSIIMATQGYGIWTLVFAPIVGFWSRAILLTITTRFFVLPSFDFRGAGQMFAFGAALLAGQGFWIIQSQADVFIAGRVLDPHDLGIYAEGLFLTQIFVAKFVPPLNEVAFPAYSRIQQDRAALGQSFLKAMQMVMLIACPLYAGMAVTAAPLVDTLFGPKWHEVVPLVPIFAIAMPILTFQILLPPLFNALGQPRLTARCNMFGALVMPVTYLATVQYGAIGLAWGWVIAVPLLAIFTWLQARPLVPVTVGDLVRALRPPVVAALGMAVIVSLFHRVLPMMGAFPTLVTLVLVGVASYAAILMVTARDMLDRVIALIFRREMVTT